MYISSSLLALNPLKAAQQIHTITIYSTAHEYNQMHSNTILYILPLEALAAVCIQEGGKLI